MAQELARRGIAPDQHVTIAIEPRDWLSEVREVVRRPRIAQVLVPLYRMRLHRIFEAAELVTISEPMTGRRDPKDDKFLELAVNGRAGVIVSGDPDLLVLDTVREIPIMTPASFRLWQTP